MSDKHTVCLILFLFWLCLIGFGVFEIPAMRKRYYKDVEFERKRYDWNIQENKNKVTDHIKKAEEKVTAHFEKIENRIPYLIKCYENIEY